MPDDIALILGIPIDHLTFSEAVDRIFDMIEAYAKDGRPRHVITVNVDFFTNAFGFFGNVRHPEFLDAIRRADMVTADGVRVLRLARLLGKPLPARIAGADLLPQLSAEARRRNKSIFLLGGRNRLAESAMRALQRKNPGLQVAGVMEPEIRITGTPLGEIEKTDAVVLGTIAAAKPDLLFMALGSPKQELWFHRNRDRLPVPVSVGVGGALEYAVHPERRAPFNWQRRGREWLYRLRREPKRLWRRNLLGFFTYQTLWYRTLKQHRNGRAVRSISGAEAVRSNEVWTPDVPSAGISLIVFPTRLDAANVDRMSLKIRRTVADAKSVILDLSAVVFADSTGLGFLIGIWKQSIQLGKEYYLVGIGKQLQRIFQVNRLEDLFGESICTDTAEAIRRLKHSFAYLQWKKETHTVIQWFGRLVLVEVNRLQNEKGLLDREDRNIICDMSSISFIDSAGLGYLIRLQKAVLNRGGRFILCGLTEPVNRMLRITKTVRLFTIAAGVFEAEWQIQE